MAAAGGRNWTTFIGGHMLVDTFLNVLSLSTTCLFSLSRRSLASQMFVRDSGNATTRLARQRSSMVYLLFWSPFGRNMNSFEFIPKMSKPNRATIGKPRAQWRTCYILLLCIYASLGMSYIFAPTIYYIIIFILCYVMWMCSLYDAHFGMDIGPAASHPSPSPNRRSHVTNTDLY